MHTLFVYGTLQHPPLLAHLIGRVPPLRPAELAGHRAAPIAGRVYPGLLVDPAATARGKVVDVDERELEILDAFEGPLYDRVDVVVSTDAGDLPAQAWLLSAAASGSAAAGDWSFERFVLSDAGEFLGRSTPGDAHPGSDITA